MAHKVYIEKLSNGVFLHKDKHNNDEGHIVTKGFAKIDQNYIQFYTLEGERYGWYNIKDVAVSGVFYTDFKDLAVALKTIGHVIFDVDGSGGTVTGLQAILDAITAQTANDNTNTTNIIDALNDNALIEFDVAMNVPASSDAEYEITPTGTEIRDYQIFEVSNPTQDITSDVSSAVSGTNKIRIFTTLPLSIKIIGTRTQV